MKRRDFVSLALASSAAVTLGARPRARMRQGTELIVAFVGGTYFTRLRSGEYLAVQPSGYGDHFKHRAFLVGPRDFGPTSAKGKVTLPDSYPLSIMHPELDRGKDHTVYCLNQADVVVGTSGAVTNSADQIANYKKRLENWKGAKKWHDLNEKVPRELNSRFLLRGGYIADGRAVNLDCAKAKWRIIDTEDNYVTLSDVAEFKDPSASLLIDKEKVALTGTVKLFVFSGPAEGMPTKKKGEKNNKAHHPAVLKTLFSKNDSNSLDLEADDGNLKVPYDLSITHPCDADVSQGRSSKDAERLIPPDTEFCVNEEGPEPKP
jgi:hypothetical protein